MYIYIYIYIYIDIYTIEISLFAYFHSGHQYLTQVIRYVQWSESMHMVFTTGISLLGVDVET